MMTVFYLNYLASVAWSRNGYGFVMVRSVVS